MISSVGVLCSKDIKELHQRPDQCRRKLGMAPAHAYLDKAERRSELRCAAHGMACSSDRERRPVDLEHEAHAVRRLNHVCAPTRSSAPTWLRTAASAPASAPECSKPIIIARAQLSKGTKSKHKQTHTTSPISRPPPPPPKAPQARKRRNLQASWGRAGCGCRQRGGESSRGRAGAALLGSATRSVPPQPPRILSAGWGLRLFWRGTLWHSTASNKDSASEVRASSIPGQRKLAQSVWLPLTLRVAPLSARA